MKKISTIFLLIFTSVIFLSAQNQSINNKDYHKKTALMVDLPHQSAPSQFFSDFQDVFQLSPETKMELIKGKDNRSTNNHLKYQETYKNLKVFGAVYILHENDGIVESANGLIYPNIDLEIQPKINDQNIQKFAIKTLNINKDKSKKASNIIPDIKFEKIQLALIDPIFPKFSGKLELVYQIVMTLNAHDKRELFIHANNGHLVWQQSLICQIDVPSTGKTKYYGTQNIVSDSINPNQFILKDNSRNITTFYEDITGNATYKSNSKNWDLTNNNLDEIALDAHYCTSRFYDMMLEKFNYKGIDGNGKEMNPVVHVEGNSDFLNAYWDGKNAYFGNGDCHHNPLTTLSIVAHEFTHGVTRYNSNLNYNNESGAINESFSDIFGKGCEFLYDKANFSWNLDPKINANKYAFNFRSFSDPNSLKMPKTYRGLYWQDFADVHINSSVFNHWFYLMVEGGSGKSEFDVSYSVSPNSMFDVLKIVFDCQENYLTPTSNYFNLFDYTKLSCEQIFGKTSKQYLSVIEAWKAVGIISANTGGEKVTDLALVINEENVYLCGSNLKYKDIGYVQNSGDLAISAGTMFNLKLFTQLNITFPLKNYTLPKNLEPGDTFNLHLPEFLINDKVGGYLISWEINYSNDQVQENNGIYKSVLIGNSEKADISINYSSLEFLECDKAKFYTLGYITCQSCDTIKAGSQIFIDHELDGVKIKTTTITLTTDFTLGSDLIYTDTLQLNKPAGNLVSTIRNSISKDNSSQNDFEVPQINSLINVKFSNLDYEEYFVYENYNIPILRIGTNDVFATKGQASFFTQEIPCLDDLRNIKNNTDILFSCLDVTNLGKTKLSFDIQQFRADSLKFPELWDNTSVLYVTLEDGNQVISKLIKSQKEGTWEHHEMILPDNYVGKLKFNFYNNLGPDGFSLSQEIFDYDAILMDNVKIEKSTGIETVDLENDLQIYPNPTSDIINITSRSNQTFDCKFFTSDGRLLKNISGVTNAAKIDVSEFQSGIYFIKVIDQKYISFYAAFCEKIIK